MAVLVEPPMNTEEAAEAAQEVRVPMLQVELVAMAANPETTHLTHKVIH